ncbi:MarR family winged helix-turn-helix transcriptional regulator [Insolitispirillum peregrinum]|uniref:MarR family winged helix-turn-helix transcriptional regulator n=1 Tax=Insolitispirillum peregrinum TaxID=80876 RepID=UPI0036125D95
MTDSPPFRFDSADGDLRQELGFHLVLLARHWRQTVDHHLHDAGLSDATWRPLVYLHRLGDGVRQKDLAAAMGMDASSVVRLLDILIRRGLVRRSDDPVDGRVKRLSLSSEGRTVLAEVQRLLLAVEHDLLADCDEDDITRMMGIMAKIARRLAKELAKELDGGRDDAGV